MKDALLVAAGILFLHETVSRLQLYGYSISLLGFTAYNVIKARQQAAAQHGAAHSSSEASGGLGSLAKGGELGYAGKGPGALLGDVEAGGKGLANGHLDRPVHVSVVAGGFGDEGTKDK